MYRVYDYSIIIKHSSTVPPTYYYKYYYVHINYYFIRVCSRPESSALKIEAVQVFRSAAVFEI